MRRGKQMVMDRDLDKFNTKMLRAVKEYNHALAKQGKEYDRNIEHVIRYDGYHLDVAVVNNKKKRFLGVEKSVTYKTHDEPFTKQFRHLMYILRRVREYNYIEGVKPILVLYYTGDKLKLETVQLQDTKIDRETFIEVDLMSMSYADANRILAKIPQKIKVLGSKA